VREVNRSMACFFRRKKWLRSNPPIEGLMDRTILNKTGKVKIFIEKILASKQEKKYRPMKKMIPKLKNSTSKSSSCLLVFIYF